MTNETDQPTETPEATQQSIVSVAPEIEYFMRCQLPSPGGFHSSPSGDTEYESAFRKSITESLPVGFEVSWNTQSQWPVDRHGQTWVKLYRSSDEDQMHHWIDECHRLKRQLEKVRGLAAQISTSSH